MSRIEVKGVVKTFAGPKSEVVALGGLDLDVADGELVVLLGPSGCGKTTLLRCVAGLESPTSGRIDIGGRTVYDSAQRVEVPPDKRDTGMVFQSYALWPHLSVTDNVAYPLRRRRVPRSDIRARVVSALELVDCRHLADRYPNELSGGQQQRIALARALVSSPRVLLFDEPLSNLDAGLRERMRLEIRTVQKRSGYTSLYVTHDQVEAMAVADRVVVLKDGTIHQIGTPAEVYGRPRTAFVASFLGSANLIPVTGRVGTGVLATPIGDVHVGHAVDPGGGAGDQRAIAVRQEDLVVGGEVTSSRNEFSATLTSIEFLGDHRSATFTAAGLTLRAKVPAAQALTVGETHRLAFAAASACEVLR